MKGMFNLLERAGLVSRVEDGASQEPQAELSREPQQAALTGESVPVEKSGQPVAEDAPIAERGSIVFKGTALTRGSAIAVVTATGMSTEIGRIAGMLQRYEREPTPLQRQLAKLGQTLVVVCLGLVGVIFLLSIWRGEDLLAALLTSVSLAVAAVPEATALLPDASALSAIACAPKPDAADCFPLANAF